MSDISAIYRNRGVNPLAVQTPPARDLLHWPLFNDANLEAYYRFEGDSNDSKGTRHGTGTDISYSTANGKFLQGARFNGGSSYITLPTTIPTLTTFSIFMWIKTMFNAATNMHLYQQAAIANNANVDVSVTDAHKFKAAIYDGAPETYVESSILVNDGAWNNVIVTRTGATMTLYINGAADGQITTGKTITIGHDIIGIGRHSSGVQYFDGAMDDFALFSRVLTPAEISAYYSWAVA